MPPEPSNPHPRLAGLPPDALFSQALGTEAAAALPPEISGVEIIAPLGRGGMGTVWRGTQSGLNRAVAVKVVAPELSHDPLRVERLEREARLMAALRHPHIVVVHQFARTADGEAAIVMELVEGGTLRDRIAAAPSGLPVADARRWAREIASALAAAHAAGVVHRDLKPENVLIGADGAARVSDFGLARPSGDPGQRLTRTGAAVGTLDYMAPEQFTAAEPDARADIYALGAVLHEMLTGRTPRGSFAVAHRVRADVPAALGRAAERALKPEPEERFSTMAEFQAALAAPAIPLSSRRTALALIALGLAAAGARLLRPRPDAAASGAGARIDEPATLPPPNPVISGGWRRDEDEWLTDDGICILALAPQTPAALDVELEFTRMAGEHSIAVFFTANGTVGSVDIDGWGRHLSGVQSINGRDLRAGGGFGQALENGRQYRLRVEVRPGLVRVFLDGTLRLEEQIGSQPLSVVAPWAWEPSARPAALAIGSYQSPTRFHRMAWREAGPG